MRRRPLVSAACLLLPFAIAACSGETTGGTGGTGGGAPGTPTIDWPAFGSSCAASGKGSFRFGAASAATQIEDQNPTTDWWAWSAPKDQGGLGIGTFVGDASKGYSKALDDVQLAADLHLDSYRFSIEWARIEPERDKIDEAALKHYDDFINALIARGIRPMVTIHHFSNPIWIADPRDGNCDNGPTDANLCGLDHPEGGPLIVKEMEDYARLLAERFGDRVDDWCTVNEPVNYLVAGYGAGNFPPGKQGMLNIEEEFVPAVRNYISAHAAMYKAVKEADKVDADGDGVAASVGFTHGAQEWIPARDNEVSDHPDDVAARDRLVWVYHYFFVEAARQGKFDANLDGTLDEDHPEWKGTLDWLGVQYYFRTGVTGKNPLIPVLNLTPCFGPFDFGACIPPLDPTYYVPAMRYEHHPEGLYTVLHDFAERWPDLPLAVTESGIATEIGKRRAEMTVRALEQIDRARGEGADVRGYYHWSLFDNFEWAEGFTPRFGLYTVDYTTYARTPTEGAEVLSAIAKDRKLTEEQRKTYGGSGPMTPEPGQ